jgi:uncharacterized protein (DUF1499 family)
MASRTINNYRLLCNTEDKQVYTWDVSPPICCPNNNTHLIDTNSITIVDNINSTAVNIIQNTDNVGDNYRVESFPINVPAGQTVISNYKWPYNISVLTINWTSDITNIGDQLDCYVAPNTVIGAITSNINVGDTVFNVSPTVIKNLQIGYMVTIINGNSNIELGECVSINSVTNQIKCTQIPNAPMPVGSYVAMTIHNVKNVILSLPDQIRLANKHLQTTFLPAGIVVRIIYKNNSNTDKKFVPFVEYLY